MKKIYTHFTAVILAAGSSRRMGRIKALLEVDGDLFINRIIKDLSAAGLENIIVVLGEHAGHIEAVLPDWIPARKIINPRPDLGQLFSIKLALKQLDNRTKGILITLVDHPLVRKKTYRMIMDAAVDDPDRIIIPTYHDRNGHPVYFGKKYFPDLEEAPMDKGARYVVNNYRSELLAVPVADEGILKDIDAPADYRKYIGGAK